MWKLAKGRIAAIFRRPACGWKGAKELGGSNFLLLRGERFEPTGRSVRTCVLCHEPLCRVLFFGLLGKPQFTSPQPCACLANSASQAAFPTMLPPGFEAAPNSRSSMSAPKDNLYKVSSPDEKAHFPHRIRHTAAAGGFFLPKSKTQNLEDLTLALGAFSRMKILHRGLLDALKEPRNWASAVREPGAVF